ncbi:stage V sporulation protein SpoVM [Paenibacillus foliorum]
MFKETQLVKRNLEGGAEMRFYTIKLPRLLGGLVKAVLSTFSKN